MSTTTIPKEKLLYFTSKFNKDKIKLFQHPNAYRFFLGRVGLKWSYNKDQIRLWELTLPTTDCVRFNKTATMLLLEALHYVRYRMHIELQKKSYTQKLSKCLELHYSIRNKITQLNLGLVHDMIQHLPKNLLRNCTFYQDKKDLQSNAFRALLASVDNFDPWKQIQFSTYACKSINNSCFELFRNNFHRKRGMVFIEELDIHEEETEKEEDQDYRIDRIKQILSNNDAELTDIEKQIISSRFGVLIGEASDRLPHLSLSALGKQMSKCTEWVRQRQMDALKKIHLALSDDQELCKAG